MHKSRDEFQTFMSTSGRTMLMKNCRSCNDPGMSKKCHGCGIDKPNTEYYTLRTKLLDLHTLDNTCKNCRSKYTRAWRRNVRNPEVPQFENPRRPLGWTPAPSKEELALWYTDIVAQTRAKERRYVTSQTRQARSRTG